MKFPDTITGTSDIPCFICSSPTEIVMNVAMGDIKTNNDKSLTILVDINTVIMTCVNCDWEKNLKEEDSE